MQTSRVILPAAFLALCVARGIAGEAAATVDSAASLTTFIHEALRTNPSIQAARTRALAAESRIIQARAWDPPQVGVEFFATPVTSPNPFKDGMETDYFLQQTIPLFGPKGLMGDAAAARAEMARESAATVERNLIAETKKAFAMIFAAQRRIDVNAANRRLLSEIVSSALTRYRVGQSTQADVLKLEVEEARLQNELSGLAAELTNATAMMNALRGLPARTPIGRVADPPLTQITLPVEELTNRALALRPELRGMSAEIDMNRAELSAANRERLPELMVRGMYKQMTEGTDKWAAMFSITLPFAPWASGKTSGASEELDATRRANEQSLVDMQNMVQAEVRDAWGNVTAGWEQLERYRLSIIPRIEQSLQGYLASYRTNSIDFLTLLDTYRMFQMARMEYIMKMAEYVTSVSLLERATASDLQQ